MSEIKDLKLSSLQKALGLLLAMIISVATWWIGTTNFSIARMGEQFSQMSAGFSSGLSEMRTQNMEGFNKLNTQYTVLVTKMDSIERAQSQNDSAIVLMRDKITALEKKGLLHDEMLKNHSEKIDDKRRCIRTDQ